MPVGSEGLQPELPSKEARRPDHLVGRLVELLEPALGVGHVALGQQERTKEPEFMFLHTKDFWFRSIWIDLHQALTIDRVSSGDRAPIGLVQCICKDDYCLSFL